MVTKCDELSIWMTAWRSVWTFAFIFISCVHYNYILPNVLKFEMVDINPVHLHDLHCRWEYEFFTSL